MASTSVNCDYFTDATPEKTNYSRVICVLLEKGSECMQRVFCDNLPSDIQNIEDAIHKNVAKLSKLGKNGKLTQQQMKFLGLSSRDDPYVDIASFDMSLWYCLIRNISVMNKSVHWNSLEKRGISADEVSVPHDVLRLRVYRNHLVHLAAPKLDGKEFDKIWKDLTGALERLGVSRQDIDLYLLDKIDPVKTMNLFFSLQKQVRSDLECYYKTELKKKKYITVGLIIVILAVIIASAITCVMIYDYSQTWTSCINKMIYKSSSQTPALSYMSRKAWDAAKPKHRNKLLKSNLEFVIISQTQATGRCENTDDCCLTMRRMQERTLDKGFDDINFNYFVGQDAAIYEGTGNYISEGARHWNNKSITIAFLGTFFTNIPNDDSIYTAKSFLQYLVDTKVLSSNFTLYGICQVRPIPLAPGCNFYRDIKTWKGERNNTWSWRSKTGSDCCNDSTELFP